MLTLLVLLPLHLSAMLSLIRIISQMQVLEAILHCVMGDNCYVLSEMY